MPDLKRIERELRQVHDDKASKVQVVPVGDDLSTFDLYLRCIQIVQHNEHHRAPQLRQTVIFQPSASERILYRP